MTTTQKGGSLKDNWPEAWRVGIAPGLTDAGLEDLRRALLAEKGPLMQGRTLYHSRENEEYGPHCPWDGGCAVALAVQAGGRLTIGEVEERFAQVRREADDRLEKAGSRSAFTSFTDWFDAYDFDAEVRPALLAAVEEELARRAEGRQGKEAAA